MNEKQQKAILLFSAGKSCVEVASELNVTPKTISAWRSSPEFRAELNGHLLDIKQANSERLRSLCMKALTTVESVMLDEAAPSKERLSAAFKVLELGKVSPDAIESTNPDTLRKYDFLNKTF
ncbi:MAG: helix-turn-helix domain-containing protein [Nitrosomonas sp.]|nr:MAG: helix-turn-helix domain-containing protein [Nitrosomonas sp.]